MAPVLIGQWEIEGGTRAKTPSTCGLCAEPIERDQLRYKWCPLDAPAPEHPWHHKTCAVRAAQEGKTAPLVSSTVRKKTGLNKLQLEEVSALLEAAVPAPAAAVAVAGVATPVKGTSVVMESCSAKKAPKPSCKQKAKKAKALDDELSAGPKELAEPGGAVATVAQAACAEAAVPIAAEATAPVKDASAAMESCSSKKHKKSLQEPSEPSCKKKAKKAATEVQAACGKAAVATAVEVVPPAAAPGTLESPAAGGGARHLAGIVPAVAYLPIKDFVHQVTPKGTAREAFENEVVPAFSLQRWGPWLSKEAQKVAGSIIKSGKSGALTPPLVYAVVLYTLDVRIGGGTLEENFYSALNTSLQQRSMAVLSKIEDYLHYFVSALEKLPPEPERVFFRGVPKSAFHVVKSNYTSGRRVHWSGISSVSEDEQVSTDFAIAEGATEGDEPGGVVFRVTARTGRRIQHLSALPAEAEVLLLPNFCGVVTKALYRSGKVWAVDIIEEADDTSTFVF